MSQPKRHHFIPVMLLKHFTDSAGRLYCCKKDAAENKIFTTTPGNALLERNLYTQFDATGVPDTHVETELSKIESATAPVIDRIVNCALDGRCLQLPAQDKQDLVRFIFCQCRRMPENRGMIEKRVIQLLAEVPDAFERYVGRPTTPEERAQIESPEYKKKALRDGFLTFTSVPLSDDTLQMVGQGSIRCGVIQIASKSFVVGMWSNLGEWLPIHQRVAIRLGGPNQYDLGNMIASIGVKDTRRINEEIVRNSNTFAGRSERLVQSLAKTC
ncbi:MAG: DUF4238 domain-containing protein [Rhodobacteraceae bacterium]|nr:DUF4238 domain-containing protein [Paracoccaceae bacterium]